MEYREGAQHNSRIERISLTRFQLTIFIAFTFGVPAFAESYTLHELRSSGYEVVWSGYAAITTCVHDEDAYELGPYLFVCNKFSYEYPYHYGDTSLLFRSIEHGWRMYFFTFICLEPEVDCIEGTLYRR